MNSDILLSEYSYHAEKKHFNWLHGLNYYFIRLQTEGNCIARVNGKKEVIFPGDLLLCQPGDACELIIDEYIDHSGEKSICSGDYFILCRGPWLDQWWQRKERSTIKRINNNKKLLILWKEIISEKRRIYEENEELLDYLLRSLCLSIDISIKDSVLFQNQLTLPVLAMKSYIEEHATQSFKIKDVANHVGFSVSRASHLFKEKVGKSMIEYAIEIRLNTAINLMKYSDMPFEQIAEISGFGSYTYFHRVFRKTYNISPTEFLSKPS
jgi:AraC family transcriptional regulator of arabinose operon